MISHPEQDEIAEKQTNEEMIFHTEHKEIANAQSKEDNTASEQHSENEIVGLVLFFFFQSLLSFLLNLKFFFLSSSNYLSSP